MTVIWFANLNARKLIKTDEGRYAEIAREMLVSGDWVTPRSNDFKYFYKPPLQYWATATAFATLGVHDWTARLWTALTGWLGILFCGFAAGRIWGQPIGVAAGAILTGSLYWIAMGHVSALDMGLASFLSIAIFAFLLAQQDDATARSRRVWMIAAWAAMALAVLSKGLIGIVLPAGAIGLYILWQRDWSLIRRMHWLSGLTVFALLAAPWFILVSMRNPEFVEFFFIREHFMRFLTKIHGRAAPWWTFFPILLAGTLPFTLGLWHAAREGIRRTPGHFQPVRLLSVWVVVVFAFFSLSSSKLPSYMLPITPALAVLIAIPLMRCSTRALAWQWLPITGLGLIIMIMAYVWPTLGTRTEDVVPLAPAYAKWVIGAGLSLAAGSSIALLIAKSARRIGAITLLAFTGLVSGQLLVTGHESFSPAHSSYHIAQSIKLEITPDTALFLVETYDHTLPFYLGRTMQLVAYKDELASAIAWEPEKFIADYAAFERAWNEAPKAVALMLPAKYDELAKRGLPMTVIARDPRRVIVKRP
ncbi:MAG: glycosyltransferase family 39 protein [Betaproteobacteria bacterium]|nr:glycosyltransferase family 39 protein [Betaproteobacteria bacterium]